MQQNLAAFPALLSSPQQVSLSVPSILKQVRLLLGKRYLSVSWLFTVLYWESVLPSVLKFLFKKNCFYKALTSDNTRNPACNCYQWPRTKAETLLFLPLPTAMNIRMWWWQLACNSQAERGKGLQRANGKKSVCERVTLTEDSPA